MQTENGILAGAWAKAGSSARAGAQACFDTIAGEVSSSAKASAFVPADSINATIHEGETLEAMSGDRLYTGVVAKILDQTGFRIRHFERSGPATPPSSKKHPASSAQLNATDALLGMRFTLKATDQGWYEAVVVEVNEDECVVRYTEVCNPHFLYYNVYLTPTFYTKMRI